MPTIRTITSPSIYVVGRQSVDAGELTRFLEDNDAAGWTTDAPSAGEMLAELAGRTCYMSFKKPRPGGSAAYLSHIIESGHGRVLEHCVFTVLIAGISRSLAQELYTHVAGISKSMLSQRFVDEGDCAFVVPPALIDAVASAGHYVRLKGDDLNIAHIHSLDDELDEDTRDGLRWLRCVDWSLQTYRKTALALAHRDAEGDATARRKAAREAARSVLPNCTETKICLTGNARAWRHFIEMRGSAGADAEIRRLSLALLPVLRAEAPHIFAGYTTPTVDGMTVIHTDHRKV